MGTEVEAARIVVIRNDVGVWSHLCLGMEGTYSVLDHATIDIYKPKVCDHDVLLLSFVANYFGYTWL